MSDVAAIFDAIDQNAAVHRSWAAARTAGMTVESGAELVVVDTGLPLAERNGVVRARLAAGTADRRIARVRDRFAALGRGCSWWVTPASRPVDLGPRLVAHGIRLTESWLCMDIPLEGERAAWIGLASPHPVRRAETPAAVADVGRVLASVDPVHGEAIVAYHERIAPAALAWDSPLRFLLAYDGAEPVATAELTVAEGVAGVYGVATRPSHRRRGFASAVIAAALAAARDAGFRTAVLKGLPIGEHVYRRLGFSPVGLLHEYR